MAKKTVKGEKTAAVSEYLDAHPGAGPKEIVAALAKQRIKITSAHVSNIKGKLLKGGKVKKAATKPAVAIETTSAVAQKPATNGGITLEQVKKVAHTIKTLGGMQHVIEVLDAIKELGGVKKFRDLAEAMTVPATDAAMVTSDDAIPY
jgi:predicted flavoprotein YhiN